jgi:proteic killer suppression protein
MIEIKVTKLAQKQLVRVPPHIAIKFEYWCDLIRSIGLREARKYKGFHDEPLQGARFGQRSVRLSKAYRAIYRILNSGELELIEILEVNKHEY